MEKPIQFVSKVLHTDCIPFEVVRTVSPTCLDVRRLEAKLDPTWKMDISQGGFVGHIHNSRSQRYTFTSNPDAEVIRIRKKRNPKNRQERECFFRLGSRYMVTDTPYKYHDYNY